MILSLCVFLKRVSFFFSLSRLLFLLLNFIIKPWSYPFRCGVKKKLHCYLWRGKFCIHQNTLNEKLWGKIHTIITKMKHTTKWIIIFWSKEKILIMMQNSVANINTNNTKTKCYWEWDCLIFILLWFYFVENSFLFFYKKETNGMQATLK